jgi:hypothetical protein
MTGVLWAFQEIVFSPVKMNLSAQDIAIGRGLGDAVGL